MKVLANDGISQSGIKLLEENKVEVIVKSSRFPAGRFY